MPLMPQKHSSVKVLYIGGMGRSGSTLLGRLLGSLPGYVNVGEVYLLWERWFSHSIRCGCGEVFAECGFWQDVFQSAFEGVDAARIAQTGEIQQRLLRRDNLPALLFGRGRAGQNDYRRAVARLYQAIAAATGARVLVDTSKYASYAYLLNGIPEIDLRFAHLVRDSRAVAFSPGRRKLNPSFVDKETYMTPHSWQDSARQWNFQNGIVHVRRPSPHTLRLRYEDLVRAPRAALAPVFDFLDEPAPSLDFLNSPSLTPDHTVSGNPIRFQPQIVIRPDLEWRKRMPTRLKILVTLATFPLLAHYGYLRPDGTYPRRRL